jgi:hypothetical protein
MARIFFVHWNESEATGAAEALKTAGHTVTCHWDTGKDGWRKLKDTPPDAVVISLDRLPSHGRGVAAGMSDFKQLRSVPLIFVGGVADKVQATRIKFPSATYCAADELNTALRKLRPGRTTKGPKASDLTKAKAVASSAPAAAAGYSGTPLPQKLGIKPNHRVALLNAPSGFDDTLGELPPGAELVRELQNGRVHDVIVLFCKNSGDLLRGFSRAAERLTTAGGLWISWPKGSSGVATDLKEGMVREIGLAEGLVDNKVCAVDATWSGLRFVIRVKDRAKLGGK